MGRILSVVLTVECDRDRCGNLSKYKALTLREAQDDALRSGWIIHSDGQTFCSAECNEEGHIKKPPRIRPGGKRRRKRSTQESR